ncbi:flagellar hook associated protein [Desulfocucumis palustris]|uniref:Flagellar hook associated protein n=1 Tax=Desulfocucumis palustris TaxID=1898651 RepID=A0A2L2XAH3_9FIRM|nr:TIGR02530 family flagellar biosynthesis protein [Desulfocucumis palustris]GBF33195.1 flagellar hook associated protein [Desulfocucumis palustris]
MKIENRDPAGIRIIAPLPLDRGKTGNVNNSAGIGKAGSFGELLQQSITRTGGLKLSAHAERRLKERNIVLGREDMAKIENAVQKAAAKGSRESLVMYGDIALVASIKNNTLITAMDGESLKEHVFTNIDSAVIVK